MGMWVEGYSMYEKEQLDEAHSVGLNEGMSIGRSEGLNEGHWERAVEHLDEKYGDGGYLKLWIPESPNAARLEELRAVIRDRAALRQVFESVWTLISSRD